jgi:hypothetical protein
MGTTKAEVVSSGAYANMTDQRTGFADPEGADTLRTVSDGLTHERRPL